MCAVLENAVECFQKQFVSATRRAKRLGEEAEEWLFSDDCGWTSPSFPFAPGLSGSGVHPAGIQTLAPTSSGTIAQATGRCRESAAAAGGLK
jgi:hypothetical protein